MRITTARRIDENLTETDSLVTTELYGSLAGFYQSPPGYADWDNTYKVSQMKVEPTIATDIKQSAFKAIGIALLLIFIYILIRFRRWQFGMGAVAALIHDVNNNFKD